MADTVENTRCWRGDGTQASAETVASQSPSAKPAWTGVQDAKLRRKLQNRINQRQSRKRKSTEREADAQLLAERLSNIATRHRRILPKSSNSSPNHETRTNQAAPIEITDETKSLKLQQRVRVHDVSHKQTLPPAKPLVTIPKGIGPFYAAHPELMNDHFLRVFQFTIQSLLPTVGVKTAVGEPVPSALCRAAMADPLVFISVLAGGSSQMCFRTGSVDDQVVLLKSESHIARVVRHELSKGTARISDAVLFGILSMALKQNTYLLSLRPEDRYAGDFDSPVKSLGGLDWLGLIDIVPEHTAMWLYLLRARNRSLSDSIPGVAEYLQSADLLRASLLLEKPRLEMGDIFRSLLDTEAAAIRPHVSEAVVFKVDAEFREVLLDLRLCCRLIHTFHGRIALDSDTSKFIPYRNLIVYRLLSLPRGRAEICRLATLAFSYGVIYPLPDPRAIRKLASQLHEAILSPSLTASEDEKFLLWAAVVGGIAAAGTGIYGSFASEVRKYAQTLDLQEWDSVLAVLKDYAWLEMACDVGGKTLWAVATAVVLDDLM